MEKDLSLCTCLLKTESDPAKHDINCKYRLRYDDIALNIAVSEEELKVLVYVMSLLANTMTTLVNEERPEVMQALQSFSLKCQVGLKQLALIRTGQAGVQDTEKKGG